MVQYCVDGRFFATLCEEDKTQARKMLEILSGEVKEEDFKGNYSLLKEDFAKGYSVEQIEEKTKNTIKPLNERLDNIPAIIDMYIANSGLYCLIMIIIIDMKRLI